MKNVFVLALLLGSSLFAQTRHEKAEVSPEQRLEQLVVKLNLNEDQANRIQVIQKEHHLKLELAKSGAEQKRKQTQAQIQTLRKELNVKMRAILTKEQYTDYQRMRARKQMNKKRPAKGVKRGAKGTRRGF